MCLLSKIYLIEKYVSSFYLHTSHNNLIYFKKLNIMLLDASRRKYGIYVSAFYILYFIVMFMIVMAINGFEPFLGSYKLRRNKKKKF